MSAQASMQALQLQGPGKLVQTTVPRPTPAAGEVLIRTRAATICTSDLHDIDRNPFGIALPRVIGHEAAGVVAACGEGVRDLSPGMRVAAHPVVPCGTCAECARGFGHLCLRLGHLGYDRDGAFAEYFVLRADRVRRMPEALPASAGALLEPVCVCLQAVARAGQVRGRKVLVAGDGPFGNIIARLARRAGADVLVTGRSPFRLGKIAAGIATTTGAPSAATFDAAVLAVSSAEATLDCFRALRPRGRLVIFSSVQPPPALDLFSLHVRELEVVGACNDEERLDDSLACLADPALGLPGLVTHELPFARWREAFELARHGHDRALKVALTFSPP